VAPRSPDLNPIDFYLWGDVKNEVYSTPITNVDELWERILATFDAIRNRPSQLECIRESMMRRLNRCVAANGQHFEHLMYYSKGYQHMNVSRYLGTCSLLDPC